MARVVALRLRDLLGPKAKGLGVSPPLAFGRIQIYVRGSGPRDAWGPSLVP